MFVVSILGAPVTALNEAIESGDISALQTETLKESFGMEQLPYPSSYMEVEGKIYLVRHIVHVAGSDKVKILSELPDPEPPGK